MAIRADSGQTPGRQRPRVVAMVVVGLVGGCAAPPRPPAPKAVQASPAIHAAAPRRIPAKPVAKVCVPEQPLLTSAQREELFRQFEQEQAKRAGQ